MNRFSTLERPLSSDAMDPRRAIAVAATLRSSRYVVAEVGDKVHSEAGGKTNWGESGISPRSKRTEGEREREREREGGRGGREKKS